MHFSTLGSNLDRELGVSIKTIQPNTFKGKSACNLHVGKKVFKNIQWC
jgi:hypothetical protein